jgi:hypothetical protein
MQPQFIGEIGFRYVAGGTFIYVKFPILGRGGGNADVSHLLPALKAIRHIHVTHDWSGYFLEASGKKNLFAFHWNELMWG